MSISAVLLVWLPTLVAPVALLPFGLYPPGFGLILGLNVLVALHEIFLLRYLLGQFNRKPGPDPFAAALVRHRTQGYHMPFPA